MSNLNQSIPHTDDYTESMELADGNVTVSDGVEQIVATSLAAIDLTGATGGRVGRNLAIHNANPVDTITLLHDDGAAPAAGRFINVGLVDMVLDPGETALCKHNGTNWSVN
jgi:hypothetical protein